MTLKKPMVFETTFTTYKASEIKGEGGSGQIYKAADESGSVYALKLLDPNKTSKEKVKRFKNELQFCLRNQHENIVTVIDHGVFKDGKNASPFYVMPFYDDSLRNLLTRGIKSSIILKYFSQILNGVEAAHMQRVIHRDLKPENVLYDPQTDNLLIADFGIAHFEEEDLFTAIETKDSARLANFQYAAPEQRGRGFKVDHLVDIYALGLILNEMFTGAVPYGTGYKTIGSVFTEYEYLDSLVSEMLRQSPSERPASIEVIKEQLIGRNNEFVARQRISRLKKTVITETDIDDPLVLDPPRLVNFDYDQGKLILILSRPVDPSWIYAFKNMGNYPYYLRVSPERVDIDRDKASIPAEEDEVQDIVNLFKEWLPLANKKYEENVRKEIIDEANRKRKRLQQEIEEQEQRQRILESVKI
jgi:serine/threonine protein kinase